MATKLPAIFEMDPNKVPISEFPISRTQPIIDYNQVCYNTASEFVEGFNQGAIMQSKAGLYCKEGVEKLIKAIGKDPCQFRLPVPVIDLRAKYFAEGLHKYKNDPEKARKYCIRKSLHNKNQEVGFLNLLIQCTNKYMETKNLSLYQKSEIVIQERNTKNM